MPRPLIDIPPDVGWRESLARNRAEAAILVAAAGVVRARDMVASLADIPEDLHAPVMGGLDAAHDALGDAAFKLRA